jgi:hypothetical protein
MTWPYSSARILLLTALRTRLVQLQSGSFEVGRCRLTL